MAKLRRMESVGAVFTEDLSSVNSLKKRGFTVNGNPTIVNSSLGKVIRFNVLGDYISIDNSIRGGAFDIGTDDFSISVWTKTTNSSSNNVIINREGVKPRWYLRIDGNGKILAVIDDGTTAITNIGSDITTNMVDGNWHHIIVTFDRSGNAQSYIDGNAEGVARNISAVGNIDNNNDIRIGRRYDNTDNFIGEMKNLMLFKRVLSPAEVLAIYQNNPFDYEKNVVSEWDMSNINPKDVGYRRLGNDGTGVSLTAASIVNGVAGGKAIDLDGSADFISTTFGTSEYTNFMTYSCWVKLDNKSADYAVFGTDEGSGKGMMLRIEASTIKFWADSSESSSSFTYTINTNVWYHIALAFDRTNNTLSLYIDGNLVATNAYTIDYNANIGNFQIGTRAGVNLIDGRIDEVIIFDKLLTNMEIMDLYKKQRGGKR